MTSTSHLSRLQRERFGAKQDMISPSCNNRRDRSVPSSGTEEQPGNGGATLSEPRMTQNSTLYQCLPNDLKSNLVQTCA